MKVNVENSMLILIKDNIQKISEKFNAKEWLWKEFLTF